MTVDTSVVRASEAVRAPSIHVERARRLLVGGAVGGVLTTALCLVGFGLAYGPAGVLSAATAGVMVLMFYAAGQYAMVLFADADPMVLLAVALSSYTTRVVLLGLLLLVYQRNADAWPGLVPSAVFWTTVAVVLGWLAAEVRVFTRLRITVYDTQYEGPSQAGGAA